MAMTIKDELPIIAVLSLTEVVAIQIPALSWLRVVLAMPFLLFFPGYALLAALFPDKNPIDAVERIALSIGLSIAVIPPLAYLIDRTPWGLRLYPILISTLLLIFIFLAVAWYRRGRTASEEVFYSPLALRMPAWRGWPPMVRVLVVSLVIMLLLTPLAVYKAAMAQRSAEAFTGFYVLGSEGLADSYPREMVVGQSSAVTVGIENRENVQGEYRVEVRIGDLTVGTLDTIILDHGESHEAPVSFTPIKAGENVKVEFLLFRNGVEGPYRSLHLWIKVADPGGGR